MNNRQKELVEFSEQVYHAGLRHKAINGSLYEDLMIKFLREDLPQFSFFKGQIRDNGISSLQYDIIICKKDTPQLEFIKQVSHYVNIVKSEDCLGVIELKKWGNPQMLLAESGIKSSFSTFKRKFPELKYFFVCLRFKDRKNLSFRTWTTLKNNLETDGNFCFFGRSDPKDKEFRFPWNEEIIKKQEIYYGEYENLIANISHLES